MAISHPCRSSGCLALFLAVCFLLQSCCFSVADKVSLGVFERACHCFDDHNVYNECAAELRLSVEGAFHVGKESVDEYCGGACFAETKLALQCVEEEIATGGGGESFRFSNGASVPAVEAALSTGCGYTPERGTFEIREREECGEYHYLHAREQEHPGYGEEEEGGENQYQGGAIGDDDYYCSGAGRLAPPQRLLLLVLLSAGFAAGMREF